MMNEKEAKDIDTLFSELKSLVLDLAKGKENGLIVYGGPGTGKTYTVETTLKEAGLAKGKDWLSMSGLISRVGLYETLFSRRCGKIIVFDNMDSFWRDSAAAMMLASALDSAAGRVVSRPMKRTLLDVSKMSQEEREEYNAKVDEQLKTRDADKAKFPSEFIFNGKIIFVSNREKFHSAVLSKVVAIHITLTGQQVFLRMKSLLPNLGSPEVPLEVKKEILALLIQENAKGKLRPPTMFTYERAERLYLSRLKIGLENWRDLLPNI